MHLRLPHTCKLRCQLHARSKFFRLIPNLPGSCAEGIRGGGTRCSMVASRAATQSRSQTPTATSCAGIGRPEPSPPCLPLLPCFPLWSMHKIVASPSFTSHKVCWRRGDKPAGNGVARPPGGGCGQVNEEQAILSAGYKLRRAYEQLGPHHSMPKVSTAVGLRVGNCQLAIFSIL